MAVVVERVFPVFFDAQTTSKLPYGGLAFLLCLPEAGGVLSEHLAQRFHFSMEGGT